MNFKLILLSLASVASFACAPYARACSRVLYVGDTAAAHTAPLLIVGRSLDWKTPIPTDIYVYPRGIDKVSSDRPGAISWTSKYGAVYAVSYGGGVTEGMNEKGLVINGLFCKGTVYDNASTASLPPMSLSMFVAWLLDLNATTPQVVDILKSRDFSISGATFDAGTVSALHWGVTDALGRSAVIEFDDGQINIYTDTDLPALTNDPPFPQINAINRYWTAIGGRNMLPGTVSSPDRFVRACYFQSHVDRTSHTDTALAIIRGILYNVSVPYKYSVATEPNVSSTQWRSYANIRDCRYYFDSATNLGIYYVDLLRCDLRVGAPVLRLDSAVASGHLGDVTHLLRPAAPFTPLY